MESLTSGDQIDELDKSGITLTHWTWHPSECDYLTFERFINMGETVFSESNFYCLPGEFDIIKFDDTEESEMEETKAIQLYKTREEILGLPPTKRNGYFHISCRVFSQQQLYNYMYPKHEQWEASRYSISFV